MERDKRYKTEELKPRRWDENGRPVYWATDSHWYKYLADLKTVGKELENKLLYGENKKG